MNSLPELYFSMESYLFPAVEEETGEITAKMKEFLRILELVRPSRFINNALRWSGLGWPMKNREKMLRAFFLKAVYDLPTTKMLIENLKTNPSYRRLCGWEYRGEVPSEATFCRAFSVFAEENVLESIHAAVIQENYTDKLVGHASMDSTAIVGRERACRKNTPKNKQWRKRKYPKSTPDDWICNLIGQLLKISQSCRKVVTEAENVTAKGKHHTGAVTNCICLLETGEFHWRRF